MNFDLQDVPFAIRGQAAIFDSDNATGRFDGFLSVQDNNTCDRKCSQRTIDCRLISNKRISMLKSYIYANVGMARVCDI